MRFVAVLLALSAAGPALAQAPTGAPGLQFSARAEVGAVSFGRFLEQRVGVGERELQADPAVQVGGSVGVAVGPASVEAGVRVAPTGFRFRDDSGTGSDALDADDAGGLTLTTGAVTLRTGLQGVSFGGVRPYALLGVEMAVWSADSDGSLGGSDDAQVRFGASTGGGLAVGAGRLGGFVEVAATALGNPFSGSDAFRAVTPVSGPFEGPDVETFDEPATVSVLGARVGLTVGL